MKFEDWRKYSPMSEDEVRTLVTAIYSHDSKLGGNVRGVTPLAVDCWGNSAAELGWTLAPALAAVEAYYDPAALPLIEWKGGGEADGKPRPILPFDISNHIRMTEQLEEGRGRVDREGGVLTCLVSTR